MQIYEKNVKKTNYKNHISAIFIIDNGNEFYENQYN